MKPGNWERELLKPATVARIEKLLRPGTITMVRVLHDSWCGIYRGISCDCNVEIVVEREELGASS